MGIQKGGNIPEEKRLSIYAVLLSCGNPSEVNVDVIAKDASVSRQAVMGLLSNLKARPGTYMKLLAAGFKPEEVPTWVARPPTKLGTSSTLVEAAKPAIQLSRLAHVNQEIQVSMEKVRNEDLTKQVNSANPPSPLGSAINHAQQQLQRPDGMIQIDGRWAVLEKTPDGLPTGAYRWATTEDYPSVEDQQIGLIVAEATLQEVTLRTRAIMSKVALNPGNVLAYEWVNRTIDPATGGPMFEGDFGDFVNWCISYAMARGYGIRIGVITTGQGIYQQMRRSQAQPAVAQGGGLVIV